MENPLLGSASNSPWEVEKRDDPEHRANVEHAEASNPGTDTDTDTNPRTQPAKSEAAPQDLDDLRPPGASHVRAHAYSLQVFPDPHEPDRRNPPEATREAPKSTQHGPIAPLQIEMERLLGGQPANGDA